MIFWKRKLKKHLPYHRLTRSAKRRLDEIAAALPARGEEFPVPSVYAQSPSELPRLSKPGETQPLRERPAAAVLRVATCALVCIAFVGVFTALLLLRSFAPVGPSSAESAASLPVPTQPPADVMGYALEIENAETRADCAFFDVVLTFSEERLRRAAFYTTALNAQEGAQDTALVIEGTAVPLDGSPVFFREADQSRYRAAVSAKLPESLTGDPLKALKAELSIFSLYGMNEGGDSYAALIEPDLTLSAPAHRSFTLTPAQDWSTLVGAANGVDLVSVDYDWDAATCTVVLKYPYWGKYPEIEPRLRSPEDKQFSVAKVDPQPDPEDDRLVCCTCVFEEIPYDAERLILTLYLPHFDEQSKDQSVQLVAEFTLFPQEGWFMRSGGYQEEGIEEFDIEQIAASWKRLSLLYTDHVYLLFVDRHVACESGESEYALPELIFYLDTDLPWALPLECEITAANGETVLVPLHGKQPEKDGSVSGAGYRYHVEDYQFNRLPHRSYSVCVTFGKDPDFWKDNDVAVTVRNTVSGRIVATTAVQRSQDMYGEDGPQRAEDGTGEGPDLPTPSPSPVPPEASFPPETSDPPAASQPPVEVPPAQHSPMPTPLPGSVSSSLEKPEEAGAAEQQ